MKNYKKPVFRTGSGGEKSSIIPEITELKNHFDLTIVSRVKNNIYNDKYNITKLDDDIKNIVIHEDNKICLIWYSFTAIFDKTWYEEVYRILKIKRKCLEEF